VTYGITPTQPTYFGSVLTFNCLLKFTTVVNHDANVIPNVGIIDVGGDTYVDVGEAKYVDLSNDAYVDVGGDACVDVGEVEYVDVSNDAYIGGDACVDVGEANYVDVVGDAFVADRYGFKYAEPQKRVQAGLTANPWRMRSVAVVSSEQLTTRLSHQRFEQPCPIQNPAALGQPSVEELWCGRSGSNRHSFRNGILNPARLPISPRPRPLSPAGDPFSKHCGPTLEACRSRPHAPQNTAARSET
jgi:hypothetical protein